MESPFTAYAFFKFPFRLQIAQAVLIIIHYVEMNRNTSYATDSFLWYFHSNKSTQPLSDPSTYLLQLIARDNTAVF